jgi:hypothetical protein
MTKYLLTTKTTISPYERRFNTLDEVRAHLAFWHIEDGWNTTVGFHFSDPPVVYEREVVNDLWGKHITHTLEEVEK